jgi:hypothetical protein
MDIQLYRIFFIFFVRLLYDMFVKCRSIFTSGINKEGLLNNKFIFIVKTCNLMNKRFFSPVVTMILFACNAVTTENSNVKKDSFDTTSTPVTIQEPTTQCYLNTNNKDTVYLKVEKFPNAVTGILKYNLNEKDINTGNIDGKFFGDTLIAEYDFLSEGQKSIRQVAFLIKDGVALEGYADMEEKNGKMIFKNISTLDFSKGLQLKKIECPAE